MAIHPPEDLEEMTDALKERIYATLAILAVLVSMHSSTSAGRAIAEIGGTALSLWAASSVAAGMAYRVVHGHLMPRAELARMVRVHAPLLWAAVPPIVCLAAALAGAIPVARAIDLAITLTIVVIVGWSLLSARAMRASWVATLVLATIEVGVGLMIVGFKLIVSE